MVGIWTLLSIFAFLINLSCLGWVYRGLRRIRNKPLPHRGLERPFSIIIAAQNEAENIAQCLNSLVHQNYPNDKFEIVLIADRCTDETVQIATPLKEKFVRLEIIEIAEVPPGVSPKKHALNRGIQQARFDHLLFLDADVIASPNHLRIMDRYFEDGADVVVGIMKLDLQNSFGQDFLCYERLLNWSVAAGSIGNGNGIVSYGGNWGYTRQAFQQVGGFEGIYHSLGGDDDLLLQKFSKAGFSIRFCADPDGWVTTPAPQTFGSFLTQRKRHFSAAKLYRKSIKTGYFIYHTSNLLLWIMPLILPPALALLVLKLIAVAALIQFSKRMFNVKLEIWRAPVHEFIYMVYNTLIAPMGLLTKIKW